MRGLVLLVVSAVCGLAAGCGSDPAEVEVEAAWQVRCVPGPGGCGTEIPQRPARVVEGVSGDPGVFASCRLSASSSENRLFSMDLQSIILSGPQAGSRGRWELQNLVITPEGFVATSANCVVRATEDGVIFDRPSMSTLTRLRCGPLAPSETQPCQVSGLSIDRNAPAGPTISGRVECRDIVTNAGTERSNIISPDSLVDAMPARFSLVNCDGV